MSRVRRSYIMLLLVLMWRRWLKRLRRRRRMMSFCWTRPFTPAWRRLSEGGLSLRSSPSDPKTAARSTSTKPPPPPPPPPLLTNHRASRLSVRVPPAATTKTNPQPRQ
ncbi:hypothetical protein IWZ03DRAFT_368966 [Phyllosticta citriasiana]|uniref:Secreted protein n=1 Tax=Phyllosticta citriasiana TaxID=595635 RepID=A0ABR1KWK4_9PEZI